MNLDKVDLRQSVSIITPYSHYYGGVESVNQMLIELLEKEGFVARIISQDLLRKGPFFVFRKRLFGLNRMLAHHFAQHYATNTDIVICNGEFSFGVNHSTAINTFHGCYYGYARAKRPYISEREYKSLIRLADQQKRGSHGKYVIADSRFLVGILKEQDIHVDNVIDNAINTDLFKPMPDILRNDRCLFVGSSDYYGKGFDILEKLTDKGIGIDCVTTSRPRDNRLGWLGNIPGEQLLEYYASYKAFILPSRFEGNSIAVLEAMACGTPIVMTNVGAGPDIAREIPDFVVDKPWEDVPDKIIDCLHKIESKYNNYAAQARDYVVRHHNYADWKVKWLNTINHLLQRSGRLRK